MSDIQITSRQSIILDPDGLRENTIRSSINSVYRWNSMLTGCIPFEVVNIAYLRAINENNGDYDTQLTGKTKSTENRYIGYTSSDSIGLKLECTGGILRFIGNIDGLPVDTIISAGNSIEFNNEINGEIYASIDPSGAGQLSYDKYTCATAYCGYSLKKLIKVEDSVEDAYYEPSPYKHVYMDNYNQDPEPEPTPDPDPEPEVEG